jgi:hypothetical protein
MLAITAGGCALVVYLRIHELHFNSLRTLIGCLGGFTVFLKPSLPLLVLFLYCEVVLTFYQTAKKAKLNALSTS